MSSIGDHLPFGDVGRAVVERVGADRPGFPVDDLVAMFELGRSVVAMLESISVELEDRGLSPARWRLLVAVAFQAGPGGASIGEIAGHLGIREPTVTSTVDRAERDGLVERRSDPKDRRVVRVVLTDQGRDLVEQLLPRLALRLSGLSRELGGPAEVTALARHISGAVTTVATRPHEES